MANRNHFRSNRQGTCWLFDLLAVPTAIFVFALTGAVTRAQSYSVAGGMPPFSAPEPVELGFADASNGNLHLEIPIGSFPQRPNNQMLSAKFVYDSSMVWVEACNGTCVWSYSQPSWRYATSAGGLGWAAFYCNGINLCGYTFTDAMGTTRYFFFTSTTCPGTNTYASDSSGYMVEPCGAFNYPEVFAPDGSIVSIYTSSGVETEDSNGNMILGPYGSPANSDTLGRAISITVGCGGDCYNVPNSQGQSSTYSVANATIPVKTNFGQSGVTEYSGNLYVVQSIALPDGTSYTFKYDCDSTTGNSACGSPGGQTGYYGLLTSVTLPTGGVISYGYTTFTDSYNGKVRWLSNRQSAGGTWTYTPHVILPTCSPTQVGCQQSVTVSKPSGASTVYTFTLNNGAWPVETQSYDSSSRLLATIKNTFDFSQACQYTGCHGAAEVRLLTTQTTMYASGYASGAITKQTKFQYDSPQTGNITAKQEWAYYSGSSPTFPSVPDRATYTTYLTTGTNDINRPLAVTLCNNSGSDSQCPGGGSKVQRTVYAYDSYSGCPSGLAVVSGTMNHDDTNFGGSYTTRGNPTQIQSWVSGSTYLTTQKCYDTTGHVYQETDPNGNVTKYGFTDNFYADNGSDPSPSYTPSKSTNAYVTSITQPIIGTSTFGYFYGSGNQAIATDANGAKAYSHNMDVLDRPTQNDLPIGWGLATYTSETQVDQYTAVGDTTASPNCVSCGHDQIVYDGWGRKVKELLPTDPSCSGGGSEIDTSYDSSGRVYKVSHPYCVGGSPVYETYSYDGLDRMTGVTHPDGQSQAWQYGAYSTGPGQQSTVYGYPTLVFDEVRNQRQLWKDGFGRTIEADEQLTDSGTATGTFGVSKQNPPFQYYGTIYLSVGSATPVQVQFNSQSTAQGLCSSIASAIAQTGLVTGSCSGTTITVSADYPGSAGDYSLSATASAFLQSNGSPVNPSPVTVTCSGMSGGTNGSATATYYTYDAAGDLTGVTQGVQARTYSYDGLGRLTKEITPEEGTITLAYTNGSSLCSGDPSDVCQKTDAKGVTTTYCYDTLSRMTQKAYTALACPMSSPPVTYTYDQGGAPAFALGRITKMTDTSGSESYTYDKLGRILQLQKILGSTSYTTGYQYNAGSELTQITYPSGRIVEQSFDKTGQLCEVAPVTSGCGSAPNPYTTAYSYDAAGNALSFNYGNGVAASLLYSTNRSQLTSLTYSKSGSTLLGLNYYYQKDPTNCATGTTSDNGMIECAVDVSSATGASGRTVGYTYDALGRLATAATKGSTQYLAWGLSWTYDRFGNRWAQSVTAGSGPAVSLAFGTNGMNGSTTNQPNGYTYDANGNMTVEAVAPPNNLSYDAENRLTSFSGGGGSGTYVYDDNSVRVQKTASGTTTVYIYSGDKDIAEYDNGAAPTSPSREFIYADGGSGTQLLARVTGTTVNFYHQDNLSTVRLMTDSSGNDILDEGTYPFGESWYSNSLNNGEWVFTTYQHDTESGLDYAMARYYDSRMGSFCSADPIEGDPNDPQTWNRYAYARNNPVNITDPSGQNWFTDVLTVLAFVLQGLGLPTAEFAALSETSTAIEGLSVMGGDIALFNNLGEQGQQKAQQPTPVPVPSPTSGGAKRITCPQWNVKFTVVGPHQAPGKSPINGEKPGLGDAAIDPRAFGLSDYYDLGKQINPASGHPNTSQYPNSQQALKKRMDEQVQLDNGDISLTPASDTSNLPDPGPYSGSDVYGYPRNRPVPPNSNSVDIYRAKSNKEAGKGTGTGTLVPSFNANSGLHCPK
jgi:RHS repeat-associated protein